MTRATLNAKAENRKNDYDLLNDSQYMANRCNSIYTIRVTNCTQRNMIVPVAGIWNLLLFPLTISPPHPITFPSVHTGPS